MIIIWKLTRFKNRMHIIKPSAIDDYACYMGNQTFKEMWLQKFLFEGGGGGAGTRPF